MRPGEADRIYSRAKGIAGWLSPEAAMLFGLVDETQRRHGISGHLFEVGAHHGKSASLLCALARPDERLGVCDLFEDQAANVSASGQGDRAVCEANIARVNPGFDRLEMFPVRSDQLDRERLPQPVRLFHVDGGHLADEAAGDLALAASVLDDRGAIVLDDPFRPEWPGVTEGLIDFLRRDGDFVSIALGFNKLLLARRAAAETYRGALGSDEAWHYFSPRIFTRKSLPLNGEPVVIFQIPSYRQLPGIERWVARGRSRAGAVRRRAADRLRR